MPGESNPGSQTTIAERSCGLLCRSAGSVRNLRAQIEMHDGLPELAHAAPARRSTAAYAATNHAGSDAATTFDGGASFCQSEIPHLRTSAFPAAWSTRSANGNQPGRRRLQSEKDAEHSRRAQVNGSPANRLKPFPSTVTRLPRRSSSSKRQKAMLRNPDHRFHLPIASRFVTVCQARPLQITSREWLCGERPCRGSRRYSRQIGSRRWS